MATKKKDSIAKKVTASLKKSGKAVLKDALSESMQGTPMESIIRQTLGGNGGGGNGGMDSSSLDAMTKSVTSLSNSLNSLIKTLETLTQTAFPNLTNSLSEFTAAQETATGTTEALTSANEAMGKVTQKAGADATKSVVKETAKQTAQNTVMTASNAGKAVSGVVGNSMIIPPPFSFILLAAGLAAVAGALYGVAGVGAGGKKKSSASAPPMPKPKAEGEGKSEDNGFMPPNPLDTLNPLNAVKKATDSANKLTSVTAEVANTSAVSSNTKALINLTNKLSGATDYDGIELNAEPSITPINAQTDTNKDDKEEEITGAIASISDLPEKLGNKREIKDNTKSIDKLTDAIRELTNTTEDGAEKAQKATATKPKKEGKPTAALPQPQAPQATTPSEQSAVQVITAAPKPKSEETKKEKEDGAKKEKGSIAQFVEDIATFHPVEMMKKSVLGPFQGLGDSLNMLKDRFGIKAKDAKEGEKEESSTPTASAPESPQVAVAKNAAEEASSAEEVPSETKPIENPKATTTEAKPSANKESSAPQKATVKVSAKASGDGNEKKIKSLKSYFLQQSGIYKLMEKSRSVLNQKLLSYDSSEADSRQKLMDQESSGTALSEENGEKRGSVLDKLGIRQTLQDKKEQLLHGFHEKREKASMFISNLKTKMQLKNNALELASNAKKAVVEKAMAIKDLAVKGGRAAIGMVQGAFSMGFPPLQLAALVAGGVALAGGIMLAKKYLAGGGGGGGDVGGGAGGGESKLDAAEAKSESMAENASEAQAKSTENIDASQLAASAESISSKLDSTQESGSKSTVDGMAVTGRMDRIIGILQNIQSNTSKMASSAFGGTSNGEAEFTAPPRKEPTKTRDSAGADDAVVTEDVFSGFRYATTRTRT